jgi:hypothetical protein
MGKIIISKSKLNNIIKEETKKAINELDARTYANYARMRQQQADNAKNSKDKGKYQLKANGGVTAAKNAWNKKYGFSNNYSNNDWNEMSMADTDTQGLSHNFGTKYGINYKSQNPVIDKDGNTHIVYANRAYNPKSNTMWTDNGQKDSEVSTYYGDEDRYRVAREMENGTGTYIKGKGWNNGGVNESKLHHIIKESIRNVIRESQINNSIKSDFKEWLESDGSNIYNKHINSDNVPFEDVVYEFINDYPQYETYIQSDEIYNSLQEALDELVQDDMNWAEADDYNSSMEAHERDYYDCNI